MDSVTKAGYVCVDLQEAHVGYLQDNMELVYWSRPKKKCVPASAASAEPWRLKMSSDIGQCVLAVFSRTVCGVTIP